MKGIVLSGATLTSKVDEFAADATRLTTKSILASAKSSGFSEIYKSCLAFGAVASSLKRPKIAPPYSALETITIRLPLLVGLGQPSLVYIELRRFIEILFWTVYFTHHPIEWQHFTRKRGSGYSKDQRSPIAFAAHKDLNGFVEYATEYMASEPSKLAIKAIAGLEQDKHLLNAATHAGDIARRPLSNPPISKISPSELTKIANMIKRVLGHAAVLMAAFDKDRFDRMPAGSRAYFDFVIGETFRKAIRKGAFGTSIGA